MREIHYWTKAGKGRVEEAAHRSDPLRVRDVACVEYSVSVIGVEGGSVVDRKLYVDGEPSSRTTCVHFDSSDGRSYDRITWNRSKI